MFLCTNIQKRVSVQYSRSRGGFESTGNEIIGLDLTGRLFFSSVELPMCSKSEQCIINRN